MLAFEAVEIESVFKEGWAVVSPHYPTDHIYNSKEEAEELLREEGEYVCRHADYTQRETLEDTTLEGLTGYLNKKYKDQKVSVVITHKGSRYEVSMTDLYRAKAGEEVWFME